MIKFLLIAYAVLYISRIYVNYRKLRQISLSLSNLKIFLDTYEVQQTSEEVDACDMLYPVLIDYPVISKYISCPELNYEIRLSEAYLRCCKIFAKLLSKRDFASYELKCSFNPFSALKVIASFFSKVLESLNVSMTVIQKRVAGIVIVLISALYEMYLPEIKSFITYIVTSLFQ